MCKSTRVQEYKSTRVQEYKSTRVQEYKSTRVQEYKSTRVQEYKSTTVQQYKSTTVQEYKSTRVQIPLHFPPNTTVLPPNQSYSELRTSDRFDDPLAYTGFGLQENMIFPKYKLKLYFLVEHNF